MTERERLIAVLWSQSHHAAQGVRAVHTFALDDLTHVGMASVMKGRALHAYGEWCHHAALVALMVERGGETLDAYGWALRELERRAGDGGRNTRSGDQAPPGDLGG